MSPAPLPTIEDARRIIAEARDGAALSDLANDWRSRGETATLLTLAEGLWTEGADAERIVAAKLLTKARVAEDGAVWATLCAWASDLTSPTALPALSAAGARRVSANTARVDEVAAWLSSPNPLARAAALGFAQDLAKHRHPAPDIAAARDSAALWAVALSRDPDAAPRRTAANFLVTLAKHAPEMVARLTEAKDAPPADLLERLKRAAGL